MLFWLTLILLIVGIVVVSIPKIALKFIDKEKNEKAYDIFYYNDCIFNIAGGAVILVTATILIVSICVIATNYFGVGAKVEQYREHYRALEFKADSQSYRDEFGLLSKEVIDEIQEWNEDIAYHKSIQCDFWLGIFYPNIYDEFETIDYERY